MIFQSEERDREGGIFDKSFLLTKDPRYLCRFLFKHTLITKKNQYNQKCVRIVCMEVKCSFFFRYEFASVTYASYHEAPQFKVVSQEWLRCCRLLLFFRNYLIFQCLTICSNIISLSHVLPNKISKNWKKRLFPSYPISCEGIFPSTIRKPVAFLCYKN